ncbi:deoxyribodipyrimidine photo-lyase [Candidatus Nitronereus thalassa]|uniref:Deoxyribodipyrimidine photo-lyase n=1 Tax=Candidatus Nitronereus thalassa TaxID=3020898 RepID=A0ABU3K892_9BACT|nr:deoxyribodipyrimidine photo-lyase [Candidatus Nitronereus thalassa]MDT7042533.1 deoxyribodipyrimidine photo-lyase [Candidatus Nitronereus thalassa]
MTTNNSPIVVWFRQDLRIRDNPALFAAHQTGHPIIPGFILDDESSGEWKLGAASRWWLHESLAALNDSLNKKLCLRAGPAQKVLKDIVKESKAESVYWNRCYEPWRIKRDASLQKSLTEQGIEVHTFNGSLLFEPQATHKSDGTPYKVFTPFYKNKFLGKENEPRKPQKAPKNLSLTKHKGVSLKDLELLPTIPWHKKLAKHWQPGEDGARARLKAFLKNGIKGYKEGRNYPDRNNVSRLSPHLHFGEISPNEVWHAAKLKMKPGGLRTDGDTFLSELGWREFSNNLLFHFPDLPRVNLQKKFNAFPWRKDVNALKRWQQGQTGYPIVDAGMRELWETGYMHNRVRMIVGSFLVKNLLLHWHHGEEWFWDTLVDADLANNSASWQWIAGCGADAAPYFRVFNPVTQGQKFDPEGNYVRRFIPELKKMPVKYLHNPWDAPEKVLVESGVKLGKDYPRPIVKLSDSRDRALEAFSALR